MDPVSVPYPDIDTMQDDEFLSFVLLYGHLCDYIQTGDEDLEKEDETAGEPEEGSDK